MKVNYFSLSIVGKFYLVDAGYPMQLGFLKLYPDTISYTWFWMKSDTLWEERNIQQWLLLIMWCDWESFRCLEKKGVIMLDLSSFSLKKLVKIIRATMALYNFIIRHSLYSNNEFNVIDEDYMLLPRLVSLESGNLCYKVVTLWESHSHEMGKKKKISFYEMKSQSGIRVCVLCPVFPYIS